MRIGDRVAFAITQKVWSCALNRALHGLSSRAKIDLLDAPVRPSEKCVHRFESNIADNGTSTVRINTLRVLLTHRAFVLPIRTSRLSKNHPTLKR